MLSRKPASPYCRDCQIRISNQKMRKRYIEESRCLDCGVIVKPKIVYPLRCEKCLGKNRKKEVNNERI